MVLYAAGGRWARQFALKQLKRIRKQPHKVNVWNFLRTVSQRASEHFPK